MIGLQLLTHNWFKKEKFKFEVSQLKKQNDLQLKKMARDLGITSTLKTPPPIASTGNILDLAKNLNPDQIAGIISALTGGNVGGSSPLQEDLEDEDEMGISNLIEFARKNPEIVKGFMSKALPKLTGEGDAANSDGFL